MSSHDGGRLLVLANPATPGAGVDTFWERVVPELRALGWDVQVRLGQKLDAQDDPWSLTLGSVHRSRRLRASSAARFDHVITSIPQSDVLWNLTRSHQRGQRGGRAVCPGPLWTIYVHGQPFPSPQESGRVKSLLWRQSWLRAAVRADGLIAVSEALAEQVESLVGRRPRVVAAPVTSSAYPTRAGTGFAVGFVGRLAPEKDPDLFAAVANAYGRRATFHVFGDGPLRKRLSESSAVELHGHVSDRDEIYSKFDVLAVTSQREGLSMASLEASSYGVIPLVAAVGGLPETIHPDLRSTLCIPASDRERTAVWAERIETLRTSPARGSMALLQQEWARSRFSVSSAGKGIDAYLRHAGVRP